MHRKDLVQLILAGRSREHVFSYFKNRYGYGWRFIRYLLSENGITMVDADLANKLERKRQLQEFASSKEDLNPGKQYEEYRFIGEEKRRKARKDLMTRLKKEYQERKRARP